MTDVLNGLLPTLAAPRTQDFNVFDVMHHGGHEKQLSNLFAWLLTSDGSHNLGDRFVQHFLAEVNAQLTAQGKPPIEPEQFVVTQEQNTRETRLGADIADIVLRGERTVIVVENFHTSDGHGHNFGGYLDYGQKLVGGRSVVVMLCEIHDASTLLDGWEQAPVVTYSNLVNRFFDDVSTDATYRKRHPDQYWFLSQMKSHFVKERQVNEETALAFVKVMCETGEAKRYGTQDAEMVFSEYIREEAEQKFRDSVALLNNVKKSLKRHLDANLGQLNEELGEQLFDGSDIGLSGVYQWDVSLRSQGERSVFVMFGPSAWTDNEVDKYKSWDVMVSDPDYSHLIIGHVQNRELRQSSVTMQDILDGLAPEDTRLVQEIVGAVRRN